VHSAVGRGCAWWGLRGVRPPARMVPQDVVDSDKDAPRCVETNRVDFHQRRGLHQFSRIALEVILTPSSSLSSFHPWRIEHPQDHRAQFGDVRARGYSLVQGPSTSLLGWLVCYPVGAALEASRVFQWRRLCRRFTRLSQTCCRPHLPLTPVATKRIVQSLSRVFAGSSVISFSLDRGPQPVVL
jgi:hypothetical protein